MIERKKKINLTDEQNKYLVECFKFHSKNPNFLIETFYKRYPGIKVSFSTLKNRYKELQFRINTSKSFKFKTVIIWH
jgi:hypothetical protein